MRRLLQRLKKQWFLLALAVLIPAGLVLGMEIPAQRWESFAAGLGPTVRGAMALFPRGATMLILFLMAYSLETRQLRAALTRPKAVLWASLVNAVLIPLAAWPLVSVQMVKDFRVGLMIAASVPCTMAAASVWTRKAGGNDAVSLMVTMLTNGLSFLVAPFWLALALGAAVALDGRAMAVKLLVAVLLPTILGQMVRLWPRAARFADAHKTAIGVAAQVLILSLVFLSAWKGGTQLGGSGPSPGWLAVLVVWGSCIALHVAGLAVALTGARAAGCTPADAAAVAFAGSQKTLPVGVLLATDPGLFGAAELGVPFAVFPMLMYHASQLFIDTAIADRLAGRQSN